MVAEAQDSSGIDNANFATLPDGRKPRMGHRGAGAFTIKVKNAQTAGAVQQGVGCGQLRGNELLKTRTSAC